MTRAEVPKQPMPLTCPNLEDGCDEDAKRYEQSEACAAGTTRPAGDDASGSDTQCEATLCAENEYVSGNACVACGAGSTNMAGDDASGADTLCDDGCIGVFGVYCADLTPTFFKDDQFGFSVSISGDTMVVGARFEDSDANGVNGSGANDNIATSGAAYVFVRDPTTGVWSQQAFLKASNPGSGDNFGHDVAIDGDTIIVGACYENSDASGVDGDQNNDNIPNSGAAYLFTRDPSTGDWSSTLTIKAPVLTDLDRFSHDVALDGDLLVCSARFEDSDATGIGGDMTNDDALDSGAAYVYDLNP